MPRLALVVPVLAVLLAVPAAAPARTPARGPALSVPAKELRGALTCSKGLDAAGRAPVLLVQGTGATAKDNWSWTYEPALDKLGVPWCQADIPDHATQDLQRNAEFVVYGIRAMYRRAGRRIAIIGHSQGGMLPRWALRFWPETRRMVDDLIGFAPSNHGTTMAGPGCSDGSCTPSSWQQWNISRFLKALNAPAETWKGISYTDVYTHTDEVVQPNSDSSGSSSLHTGHGRIANVATQDICPLDVNEHLLVGLIDPVAYALAVDALTHDGPADPRRVRRSVCLQVFQPGINPATAAADGAAAAADFEGYSGKEVPAEPPLRCYVTKSCPGTRRG